MTSTIATRAARDSRRVRAGRGRVPAQLADDFEEGEAMNDYLRFILFVVGISPEVALSSLVKVAEAIEDIQ